MSISAQVILDDYKPIGSGLMMPSRLQIDVVDEPEPGMQLAIGVVLDETLRRYAAHELRVLPMGGGTELSATLLRSLRIQDYIRRGLQTLAVTRNEDGSVTPFGTTASIKAARAMVPAGPVEDMLKVVASHYRHAEVLNLRPAKAVAEALGIPYPTATNWIARARAAKWLD